MKIGQTFWSYQVSSPANDFLSQNGENGQILTKSKAIHFSISTQNQCHIEFWKVVKIGKYQVYSLTFGQNLPNFTKIQCDWFWVEIEKWWKWADFDQKVRLYTWYFDQFSPKFNVTDFEWRLKSGENGQILTKK